MFLENAVNGTEQFGWIEVICGSMFSGKTEELIRRLRRAQFAKQKIEIFKPAVDLRYDSELVTSHDQNQIPSTPVPAAANIPILPDHCTLVRFHCQKIVPRLCLPHRSHLPGVTMFSFKFSYRLSFFIPTIRRLNNL